MKVEAAGHLKAMLAYAFGIKLYQALQKETTVLAGSWENNTSGLRPAVGAHIEEANPRKVGRTSSTNTASRKKKPERVCTGLASWRSRASFHEVVLNLSQKNRTAYRQS